MKRPSSAARANSCSIASVPNVVNRSKTDHPVTRGFRFRNNLLPLGGVPPMVITLYREQQSVVIHAQSYRQLFTFAVFI
jgi:hypothetical protein